MRFKYGVLFGVLVCTSLSYATEPINLADQIVRKADDVRGPQEAFSMSVSVQDSQKGVTKESVYRVYSKGTLYSLVEQTEPVRAQGRKLLMRDHDLWLFTPSVSRPTRVSFELKLTGEVANGDLMRTNFAADYSASILGEEILDGKKAFKLKLDARNKMVTYRRIDYWVEKEKSYPIKAQFYALSGKLLKTAVYSEIKSVFGKPRMTKILITDSIQANHTSLLKYSQQKKENLDDSFFNKESLGN